MKSISFKLSYDYREENDNDSELDRDKYLIDLMNCETFEEFLNTLTTDDYELLANAKCKDLTDFQILPYIISKSRKEKN